MDMTIQKHYLMLENVIYQKQLLIVITSLSMDKNFYFTTKDYITECFIDYDYIISKIINRNYLTIDINQG